MATIGADLAQLISQTVPMVPIMMTMDNGNILPPTLTPAPTESPNLTNALKQVCLCPFYSNQGIYQASGNQSGKSKRTSPSMQGLPPTCMGAALAQRGMYALMYRTVLLIYIYYFPIVIAITIDQ